MTLQDAQGIVDQWIKEYGVRYFDVLTNTVILNEEIGEYCRIVARMYGEQSMKKGQEEYGINDLSDEMADILFVLICLANQTGIDLGEALQTNLQKKTKRDRDRHSDNPKLNS